MYQDVVELRSFYDSPLGRITARLIRRQIAILWPDIDGTTIMGIGYTTPYLDVFRARADHLVSIMPTLQGVVRWPRHNGNPTNIGTHRYRGNLTCLADEDSLPLRDASIDRILMIHTLEHTEQSRQLLREIWRSLAPGGRVIIVVPNRLGLWARTDKTPFGHGTPFTTAQARQLLNDNMLIPTRTRSALHTPPFQSRSLFSVMTSLENIGQKWWHNLAGVLIIEAEKQIYATDIGSKTPVRNLSAIRRRAIVENRLNQKK